MINKQLFIMCGIAGFNWKDEKLIKKITDLLKHRGPDQKGFYFDNGLSLGHRRLSIIDLSNNASQPMVSSDGQYAIVFNGEIFNYKEIMQELKKIGYKFRSRSDTEVLLNGYIEFGKDVLKMINGQFAFAIYDKNKKEILLARDRAGINPLYYYNKDGNFIFGSELKTIMCSGINKRIDKFSLNYYFLFGHTPSSRSILENCHKLEKSTAIIFDLKNKKIKQKFKYWEPDKKEKITDETEAKNKILEQLERAVKSRLVSDVPVGAFLSGGVDSSAIVALMSRHTKELNTFSIKFDNNEFDESEYAKIVSDKFNTKHHVIEFTSKDVRELIPELAYHYDEPFADFSMIPTFLVSKVAKQHVTVSLSGDGGDELFGGYDIYNRYRKTNIQKFFPRSFFMLLSKLFGLVGIKNGKLLKFINIGKLPKKEKYAKLRSYLYDNEFKMITGEDNMIKYYKEYVNNTNDDRDEDCIGMNIDINTYLVDDILTKVDRASLGNSLESRPPILDHKIMELADRISPKLKIKNGQNKYILKKALEDILPEEILYRKKQGFGVPLKYYLRKDLKDLVEKYIFNFNKHNLYSRDIVDNIKRIIEKKEWDKDYSRVIWSIMIFNIWYERWMLNDN